MVLNIFSYSDFCYLFSLYGEVSLQVSCLFSVWLFFLLLNFKSSLYILVNSLLSSMSFVNISSHSGFSSWSLDIVFCSTDVFHFNEAQHIITFFMGCDFGVLSEKSSGVSPVISSRSFIVLH